MDFKFNMPTTVFFGEKVLENHLETLKNMGTKAFIITGKNSSKTNGSLSDVEYALTANNIEYIIFDEIEENPSVETIMKASEIGKKNKIDFLIGVGGGSPIDASKAISVLIKNPDIEGYNIFTTPNLDHYDVIAVPTTAGTGTEVTQYAILTDNVSKTKSNFNQTVFPKYAFIDPNYMMDMSSNITINTAIDALSHLIEGYLSVDSNIISDLFAKEGLAVFSKCIDALESDIYTYETRENLALASMYAGIVIAQSGTSLPHGMGYALTYHHGFPHGKANGILLKSYLHFCNNNLELKPKVESILALLGFKSLSSFGDFIKSVLPNTDFISENNILHYAMNMVSNKGKLKKHLGEVTQKDIYEIYIESLM